MPSILHHSLGYGLIHRFAQHSFCQGNRALQTLDLRRNSIGSDGAKALAEALKVGSDFREVNASLTAMPTIRFC